MVLGFQRMIMNAVQIGLQSLRSGKVVHACLICALYGVFDNMRQSGTVVDLTLSPPNHQLVIDAIVSITWQTAFLDRVGGRKVSQQQQQLFSYRYLVSEDREGEECSRNVQYSEVAGMGLPPANVRPPIP
jgi:hypothetical protein